jgi:hypothetical protein
VTITLCLYCIRNVSCFRKWTFCKHSQNTRKEGGKLIKNRKILVLLCMIFQQYRFYTSSSNCINLSLIDFCIFKNYVLLHSFVLSVRPSTCLCLIFLPFLNPWSSNFGFWEKTIWQPIVRLGFLDPMPRISGFELSKESY